MSAAQLAPNPVFQAFGPDGKFLVGGQLFTYAAGTSNAQATYIDATRTTQNTNPVILNAMGQANIWLDPTLSYKWVLKDAAGNVMWTVDNINGALSTGNSIIAYGADPTGVQDSTAAIVAAIAANTAVFVPPGTFKFTQFTMPTTFGFVLYGVGTASILKQVGTGITWPSTGTGPPGYYEGYISNLAIYGTTGTGHCINTQFAGGVTLENIYIGDLPVGFDGLHLQGAPASTGDKYSHDVRVLNLQIYTNTAGRAGIYIDQFMSDASIDGFIMNGNQVALYNVFMANGSQTISFANMHPYNGVNNIVFTQAGATIYQGLTFTNCTFDNVLSGLGDNVVLNNCAAPIFDSCWFEAVRFARNGLTLNNCSAANVMNCRFDGVFGSGFMVNETGTTNATQIIGVTTSAANNFSNPPFNLIGAQSFAYAAVGANTGQPLNLIGSTTNSVAAASTVFLGVNGAQAAANSTEFMCPFPTGLTVQNATIAFDTAPGAGTFTFTLLGNGATLAPAAGSLNPVTVTGSVFTVTIKIAQGAPAFVAQFQQIGIKLVTSAGAGTPNLRYCIQAIG